METHVADSDRGETPAPLGDRAGLGGAGVTEAVSAGSAVVLGVVGPELVSTFMAILRWAQRMIRQLAVVFKIIRML